MSLWSLVYGANMDNRYLKDSRASWVDSLNLTLEVGYGRYLIDVTSSELSRAIDYSVWEATLGASMSLGDFHFGLNTKALIDEHHSNLSIENSQRPLNDNASISRIDYSLYAHYTLHSNASLNLTYKYYSLKAQERYLNFRDYDTRFEYHSSGVALSYLYTIDSDYDGSDIVVGMGGVYNWTKVAIHERVDGVLDDVFIDDAQGAWGIKLVAGYAYKYDNSYFTAMVDWYGYDFGRLDVRSHFLDEKIEQASLTEETYSLRLGYIYKF